MKSNRVIIISLGVPLAAIFLLWLAYRFYTPDKSGPYSTRDAEHRVYADDGRTLPIRVSGPADAQNIRGVLFMHSDRGLDRDWNSQSADFRTGARLNRIFASHGLRVVSYDQRDLGAGAGPRFANIDDLAADLRVVTRFYFKRIAAKAPGGQNSGASNAAYSILAHGQGCLAALRAISREKLRPRKLYLVNCVYTGSLLESWGDRILNNMRRAGVSPVNLSRARGEFEVWLKTVGRKTGQRETVDGETKKKVKKDKEKKERVHPDILGFRRALEFLESPEMRDWTRQAANLYFERELRVALGRGIRVVHWISRHDTEFPPERVAEAEKAAANIAAGGKAYRFEILPRSNHFLKVQSSPSQGALSITWNRANPFAPLSPAVLREFIGAKKAPDRDPGR